MENRITAPLAVMNAGCTRDMPWHSSPGTRQNHIMLTAITAGAGVFHRAGRRLALTAGMVGLVGSKGSKGSEGSAESGVQMADPSDPYVAWHVRFTGDHARELCAQVWQAWGVQWCQHQACERVAACIARIGSRRREHPPTLMGSDECALAEALVALLPQPAEGAGDHEPHWDRYRVQGWIDRHIAEDIDLQRAAAAFGASRATVARRVRAICGRSLQQQVQAQRLERAQFLLRSTDLPVRDVARRVGYADALYFSRVFAHAFGVAPSQWRAVG
ncbi:MAG: AraC family transcriptional regulator [Planctomycetota bacterium]|jgi:AraC-like DNA-binding protein|nr:AraC family transcriptional regulator [Planctomycetota bacterium]